MGAKQELVKELEKKEVMDKSDKDDHSDGDGVVNCPSRQSLTLFIGPLKVYTQRTRKYSTAMCKRWWWWIDIQIKDKLDKNGDDDVKLVVMVMMLNWPPDDGQGARWGGGEDDRR